MSQGRLFDTLDLDRPWFALVREEALALAAAHDWRAALNGRAGALGLVNARGLPLSFVPQESLPPGMAYEAFIFETGQVPTRENLHDFFNALVWLNFPLVKRQLNALQAAQIARDGIGKSRGAARDGATLFDENAALVVLRARQMEEGGLADALRRHEWQRLFLDERAAFETDCRVWLFGHALMEKLAAPYKAITAHAYLVAADEAFFSLDAAGQKAWLDTKVAGALAQGGLSPASFTPLPVLGLPGWWPGQDGDFYADGAVFRPPRQRAPA